MSKGFRSPRVWLKAVSFTLFLFSTVCYAAPPGLMLSYELTHDMLPMPDNFSVSVYEDGVALVHFPEYMEPSGDYIVTLTPSEVQQIRLLMEHPLVQGFDPGQARKQKKTIDSQSQELFAISDDSYSNFEIHAPGARKSIRWANLSIDTRRYPEIGVFRKLADIEAELLNLDKHPNASALVD